MQQVRGGLLLADTQAGRSLAMSGCICTEPCSIWCSVLTVYVVRVTALAVAHEYACLIVRGYKTAETKKTAHLKKMCGRYVVLYAKQLPAKEQHRPPCMIERLPATSPERMDELRRHWPDVSDVMIAMMNSPWTQGCENSDTGYRYPVKVRSMPGLWVQLYL